MPAPPPSDTGPRRATLLEVIRAVFWSFLGIRRQDAMQRDAVTIRPHQVIIVGVVAAVLFVLTLLAIVRIIIANAT